VKGAERSIMHEINRVLGENTISYSTIRKSIQVFVLSTNRHSYRPESACDFSLDDCTAPLLSEASFLPVHQNAKKVTMSKATRLDHLTQTVRWKVQYLKRVSRSLTEFEKMNLVQTAT
jgi:hypothetical protein